MSSEDVTTTEVARMEQPEHMNMSVALVEAEARARLMKNILPQLVAVCHKDNILKMGNGDKSKPYITNDGCQKIARIAGISFGKPAIDVSYENLPAEQAEYWEDSGKIKKKAKPERRAFIVEVYGEATLLGQTITEFGGASSEDGFYDRPKESPVEIRLEVRKKAMANWQGRCVRTLLGLQGLSWEDLKKVGFDPEQAGGVEYETGKYSSRKDTSEDKNAGEEVRNRIRDMILRDVAGNQDAAVELLETVTSFKGKDGNMVKGKKNVAHLSESAANTTWNKIKPGSKERDKYFDSLRDVLDKHGINPDEPPEGEGVLL